MVRSIVVWRPGRRSHLIARTSKGYEECIDKIGAERSEITSYMPTCSGEVLATSLGWHPIKGIYGTPSCKHCQNIIRNVGG
jgi:hypothetical protein